MLSPEEFEELWMIERTLVGRGWERDPEKGPGMWRKADYGGKCRFEGITIREAYEWELAVGSVN